MIDGVKISYEIKEFELWKSEVDIEFGRTVLDSGEVKQIFRSHNKSYETVTTHRAKFRHYRLTVKEVERKTSRSQSIINYYLTIDGSFHKNFCQGTNYEQFCWENLQHEISLLENTLQLSLRLSSILNIEIGVNIEVPYSPFDFLRKNLLSYKGNPFNMYPPDSKGMCLGYFSNLSQYQVKIYDKGMQYNLFKNLMRFELRFLKMQSVKKAGIATLADLRNYAKVKALIVLLTKAWDNVLIYDSSINVKDSSVKAKDLDLLRDGKNPKYWEQLKNDVSNTTFYKLRSKFKNMVSLYGCNVHSLVKNLVIEEWNVLSRNQTISIVKNMKENNFPFKLNGKIVQPLNETKLIY